MNLQELRAAVGDYLRRKEIPPVELMVSMIEGCARERTAICYGELLRTVKTLIEGGELRLGKDWLISLISACEEAAAALNGEAKDRETFGTTGDPEIGRLAADYYADIDSANIQKLRLIRRIALEFEETAELLREVFRNQITNHYINPLTAKLTGEKS